MTRRNQTYAGCTDNLAGSLTAHINALASRLDPVSAESIDLSEAIGRVLAQAVCADRDSPAADVSAVDGYALRLGDVTGKPPLPVVDQVTMGAQPKPLGPGAAMLVFTGGVVPAGAEVVVRRELCEEHDGQVTVSPDCVDLQPGANIRRRGQNIKAGQTVIDAGRLIDPGSIAALAGFGFKRISVHRPVRVALIVTGDELRGPDEAINPAVIRDSNGPSVSALLGSLPWIDLMPVRHVRDNPSDIRTELQQAMQQSDAVVTTGGVSMGDHDHVPGVLKSLGVNVMFHGLPIRPGRPMLGGVGPNGRLILGLPGNPGSVLTTLRRFGIDLLYRRAGGKDRPYAPAHVHVKIPLNKVSDAHWFRPARFTQPGEVELTATQGSGDLAALARSDGFIEHPADRPGSNHAEFWPWRL